MGAGAFAILQWLPAPAGLNPAGWDAAAVTALVAIWWITEALPLSATALLPVILFPALEVIEIREAARPYASHLVLLMVGGFMIALGMQRWNLHKRIALKVISFVGSRPTRLVLGFMTASALISMWVFNTTTAVMMVPIALSVIDFVKRESSEDPRAAETGGNFAAAVMIGIAYGATIGGMGTLIGTAPNAILAGFMAETYGFEVSFLSWMLVGVPMGCLMLPILWWVLVHWVFPISDGSVSDHEGVIAKQLAGLGPMVKGERIVAGVVCVAAVLWVFRPWIDGLLPFVSLSDTTIALGCGVALFILPVDWRRGEFALGGEWAKDLPWGVLLLFGGGLSLAAGIKLSGLADWIGASTGGLAGFPTYVVILGIVVVMIVLTEFASNTATTATFLPIAAAVAVAIGENPLLLVFPTVLAASCAFMMPVATPPNAVVFGSGQLRIGQFMRAGIYGNLAGLLLTMLMVFSVVRWVFGIELGVLPGWAAG